MCDKNRKIKTCFTLREDKNNLDHKMFQGNLRIEMNDKFFVRVFKLYENGVLVLNYVCAPNRGEDNEV